MIRIVRAGSAGLLLAVLLAAPGCSDSERESLLSPTDCPCFSRDELDQETAAGAYQCFDLPDTTAISATPDFSYQVTQNPQTGDLSCRRSSQQFEDNVVAGLSTTQAAACADAILASETWGDCP